MSVQGRLGLNGIKILKTVVCFTIIYQTALALIRWFLCFRMVCEALLESERLTIRNSKFWINSFVLIKKIIAGVDYKGVREIMKVR